MPPITACQSRDAPRDDTMYEGNDGRELCVRLSAGNNEMQQLVL